MQNTWCDFTDARERYFLPRRLHRSHGWFMQENNRSTELGVTWKWEEIKRKEMQSVMRDGCKVVEHGRQLESDPLRIAAWEEAVFPILSIIILSFPDFTAKQSSG